MVTERPVITYQETPVGLAKNCFPDSGPVLINQKGISGDYLPIRKRLVQSNLSREQEAALDLLVNKDGYWIYSFDRLDIYGMPLDELTLNLTRLLSPIYLLVNSSLSTIGRDFNRHGLEEHVLPVGRRGRLLIRDSFDESRERNFIIAALAHDIHQAITEQQDPHSFLNLIRKEWGEVSLALLLADKTDVGTRRVGLEAGKQEGIVDIDSHAVANLLMETGSVDCSGSAMRWVLDFTPQPANEQEAEQLSACVRPRSSGTGNRWSVPKEMRDLYRNNGISHFDTAKNRFIRLYFDRIRMAILCGLALTDGGKFELTLRDLIDAGGAGSYFTIKTTPETVLEWFKKDGFWPKKYIDKKERRNWPY